MNECQRPTLAEVAIYSFPRGGQNVTGPSIRLAEVIKRHWGHMRSGWRCIERTKGRSLLEAYAYDIQNNVGENRTFEVRHVRDTKKGQYPITDERDIYELEANQAARRVRACILALVDGDVVEAALDQCTRTLEAKADTTTDGIKRMMDAFKPFNVNQKMIEARIGRNVSSITAAQMVGLKNILNGMKDGMSSPENWFDVKLADSPEEKNSADAANAALKEKIKQANPAETKTAEQVEGEKVVDVEAFMTGFRKAINEALTVHQIDQVWNEYADSLASLKSQDLKKFEECDKGYITKRDALEKQDKNVKQTGKLV